MIEVNLKLFGALREYDLDGSGYTLQLSSPAAVATVKELFLEHLRIKCPEFKQHQLIKDSALATDSHVLTLSQSISASCTLYVLPPVCGG